MTAGICPLRLPHRWAGRRASDQLDAPGSLSSPGTPPCAHRLLFDHRPVRTQFKCLHPQPSPVAGNCSIAVATVILHFLIRPVAPGPAARCAEPGGLTSCVVTPGKPGASRKLATNGGPGRRLCRRGAWGGPGPACHAAAPVGGGGPRRGSRPAEALSCFRSPQFRWACRPRMLPRPGRPAAVLA